MGNKKHLEYAVAILGKIDELFSEEGDFHIDLKELEDGENGTHFIHALANIVPTAVFNNLTGNQKSNLEVNHIANQLLFQYVELELEKEEEDEDDGESEEKYVGDY